MMGPLLELERELAGVVNLPDLTGIVLQRLHQLVGAAGSTLFTFDRQGAVVSQGGTLASVMQEYSADLFESDDTWKMCLTRPGHELLHFADDRSAAAIARSRAYAEFYQPREIGYICGVWPTGLAFGASGMFGILLATPSISTRFEQQHYDGLRWLETPLRAAARRLARFGALEREADVLRELLERQRRACALWDADGRLVLLTAQAQRRLAGGVARSDLELAARIALRQLRRTDRAQRDALLGRPRQLRSRNGAPLSVEFSWIAASDGRPWLLAQIEEGAGVRALLGQLTPAETRVLRLVVKGYSNREIAESLAVSGETVRTHMKRVLMKLGVNSRLKAAALARQIWNVC